ncbi:MAG: UDP-N-acetylmuramoyl-tripeptide--D-alanyl-D-alanine ligase [Candidatus Latescibacteria bacterium]|nr:UDP-N-acetylmuramoyl-tripeptide--D-alanyl-D-alanine ligase [Candidatus Latescibacterota bacterium]
MSDAASPWLSLEEVMRVTGGRFAFPAEPGASPPRLGFSACAIDSRALEGGELFVPLPGSKADGHDFVSSALASGAAGSLVGDSRPRDPAWRRTGKPVIAVKDPLRALQSLGRHCRVQAGLPTTAVTGSNGKTTTKEMIAAVLGTRFRVHKNSGNLNNHIGLPLTLTWLRREHEMLVIELGMSARGEIRELALLCLPEVGVLTNAAPAHLASLHTVEEVARAKSELAEALPRDGLLVLNADDELLWKLNRGRPTPMRSYALDRGDADLRPTTISSTASGGTRFALADGAEVELKLLGRHNARNALAAILVGDRFGIPRAEAARALGVLEPQRHRLELLTHGGISILDDAYNANPASMREALILLGTIETKGERRAVLGDMLELGPDSERFHEEMGRALPSGAWLYVAGAFAEAVERGARAAGVQPARSRRFASVPEMADAVRADARPGDLVLVKASRGMRLEQVVEALAPGRSAALDPLHATGRS